MSITLKNGDALNVKQDTADNDVILQITGDDLTTNTGVDDFRVLVAQTITNSSVAYLAPAANRSYIVKHIKITNPSISASRVVTFYLDNVNPAVQQWGSTIALGPGQSKEWNGDGWGSLTSFKTLYQAQLPSSVTTLVTVSAGKNWVVNHIRVVNTTSGALTFQLFLNGSTAPYAFTGSAITVPANGIYVEDLNLGMEVGEYFAGVASSASSLSCIINGQEIE